MKQRIQDRRLIEWLKNFSCVACGSYPVDIDHIKTRGAGGDDSPQNLMPLCRSCHTTKHSKGILHMVKTYPTYRRYLQQNGWTIDPLKGTYTNPIYDAEELIPTPT